MAEHKWLRTLVDAAMWCLWTEQADGSRTLEGIIVAHVDDLLFTGSKMAEDSLMAIGAELGFGSLGGEDFVWCGKRIRRHQDGTIRLSMREYHENLQEVNIPRRRKNCLDSPLEPHEARQLRGILGSLQWLVAQVRFDMSFGVFSASRRVAAHYIHAGAGQWIGSRVQAGPQLRYRLQTSGLP